MGTIRRLEATVQQIHSTSGGGQAPPTDSLEENLESISDVLEDALVWEFSATFGSENRESQNNITG